MAKAKSRKPVETQAEPAPALSPSSLITLLPFAEILDALNAVEGAVASPELKEAIHRKVLLARLKLEEVAANEAAATLDPAGDNETIPLPLSPGAEALAAAANRGEQD